MTEKPVKLTLDGWPLKKQGGYQSSLHLIVGRSELEVFQPPTYSQLTDLEVYTSGLFDHRLGGVVCAIACGSTEAI